MIKNRKLYEQFERDLIQKQEFSIEQNHKILETLLKEEIGK